MLGCKNWSVLHLNAHHAEKWPPSSRYDSTKDINSKHKHSLELRSATFSCLISIRLRLLKTLIELVKYIVLWVKYASFPTVFVLLTTTNISSLNNKSVSDNLEVY